MIEEFMSGLHLYLKEGERPKEFLERFANRIIGEIQSMNFNKGQTGIAIGTKIAIRDEIARHLEEKL